MSEESSEDADVKEGESYEEKSLKTTEFPNVKTVVVRDQEKGKLIFNSGELEQTFELSDLLKASAEGLGKGIFGNTYKAKLDGDRGKSVVVKRLRDLKPLTGEEFERQLKFLLQLKHPNLLPLVAHYYAEEEKLLLFKYAQNGNLFSRIHGERGPDRIPFRWSARLSVSRVVARALEYLHTSINTENFVPHGNLKPSNILFDENDIVLVSDYGFASLVASPIAVDRMLAYKSPEYQSSKKMSKKSDVWSYGCLILELLTGRISIHSAPPGFQGIDLSGWVRRAVREEWTAEIFDSEINGQRAAASGMLKLLQIAIRCCDKVPENRPEMWDVVREVENIKFVESENESDVSIDDLTDESRSTIGSGIVADER
jgi:serine/threonine protein kinase